jgi:hypothetical protein
MSNRIIQVQVEIKRLSPVEAELQIMVLVEKNTESTEIRGRFVGPRCLYASTVEVAYPIQAHPHGPGDPNEEMRRAWNSDETGWRRRYAALGGEKSEPPERPPFVARRVLIPEPSLWEPQTPFLYTGLIELWQDARRCDGVTVTHGFRSLHLGASGLRVNDRLVPLHGTYRVPASKDEALALRGQGYNLLVAPHWGEHLWPVADEVGFLVLGRVMHAEGLGSKARILNRHPCWCGWLFGPEPLDPSWTSDSGLRWLPLRSLRAMPGEARVGIEVDRVPTSPLPQGISFVACRSNLLPALTGVALPKLVLRTSAEVSANPALLPGVFGSIDI